MAIWTRAYDNGRSGATTTETILTPSAVKQRGIKRAFSLPTPDDKRGCEAQPLVIPNVAIGGGAPRTVVFLASMANDILAYDARDGTLLWRTNLGRPVDSQAQIDMHLVNDHWGIVSTPVIDAASGVLYACAWSSPTGDWTKAAHSVHAIRITDGHEVRAPLNLEGATYRPPGLPELLFRSSQRKQRAALLLLDGAIFIGFGTVAETAAAARGWLIAIDVAAWTIAATWCSTSRGSGGGIWMSGSGPAVDADGNIFVMTGNGSFDGVTDFGESLVKLKYERARAGSPAKLTLVDWWTPWTDRARTATAGAPSPRAAALRSALDGQALPSNFQIVRHLAHRGIELEDMGAVFDDQDFGSGGPVFAESADALLTAGKDGILYTANPGSLGKTLPANLEPAQTLANYRKLKSPPILYTYFDPAIDPAPADVDRINAFAGHRTHHLHGTPVSWTSAVHGPMHFCGGENGNLRAWSLSANGASTYLACSSEVASPQSTTGFGGMPGWMITLSSSGEHAGIVWALVPYGDANMGPTAGRLIAYDAQNFDTFGDGSKQIVPLWDSQDWGAGAAFTHPKFNRPVAFEGQLYVPTYDGRVDVYLLA